MTRDEAKDALTERIARWLVVIWEGDQWERIDEVDRAFALSKAALLRDVVLSARDDEPCPECGGYGYVMQGASSLDGADECPKCRGRKARPGPLLVTLATMEPAEDDAWYEEFWVEREEET